MDNIMKSNHMSFLFGAAFSATALALTKFAVAVTHDWFGIVLSVVLMVAIIILHERMAKEDSKVMKQVKDDNAALPA